MFYVSKVFFLIKKTTSHTSEHNETNTTFTPSKELSLLWRTQQMSLLVTFERIPKIPKMKSGKASPAVIKKKMNDEFIQCPVKQSISAFWCVVENMKGVYAMFLRHDLSETAYLGARNCSRFSTRISMWTCWGVAIEVSSVALIIASTNWCKIALTKHVRVGWGKSPTGNYGCAVHHTKIASKGSRRYCRKWGSFE